MAALISFAVLLTIVAVTQQSPADVERQVRDLVSRRQHLANLRRVLNNMDFQLADLHKRACLNMPGAVEQCDANAALGSSLDREFVNSLNSPGKRDAPECQWGPNGELECENEEDFINSLKSPGKRNAPKPQCKWGANGLECEYAGKGKTRIFGGKVW